MCKKIYRTFVHMMASTMRILRRPTTKMMQVSCVLSRLLAEQVRSSKKQRIDKDSVGEESSILYSVFCFLTCVLQNSNFGPSDGFSLSRQRTRFCNTTDPKNYGRGMGRKHTLLIKRKVVPSPSASSWSPAMASILPSTHRLYVDTCW
jgi:hypothetical protein